MPKRLSAPESALGLDRCNTSLSLSLSSLCRKSAGPSSRIQMTWEGWASYGSVRNMIGGNTLLRWEATDAFLRPSRSLQYWLLGRQVQCHPAAASHTVKGEVVDPGTSARSRHNVLACRSCAPAAEQPRINGMALWPVGNLLWPILGALLTVLNEHMWQQMDALHAAHFELLVPWPALCVCVRTCVLPYCSSCLWYIQNSNHIF